MKAIQMWLPRCGAEAFRVQRKRNLAADHIEDVYGMQSGLVSSVGYR